MVEKCGSEEVVPREIAGLAQQTMNLKSLAHADVASKCEVRYVPSLGLVIPTIA